METINYFVEQLEYILIAALLLLLTKLAWIGLKWYFRTLWKFFIPLGLVLCTLTAKTQSLTATEFKVLYDTKNLKVKYFLSPSISENANDTIYVVFYQNMFYKDVLTDYGRVAFRGKTTFMNFLNTIDLVYEEKNPDKNYVLECDADKINLFYIKKGSFVAAMPVNPGRRDKVWQCKQKEVQKIKELL